MTYDTTHPEGSVVAAAAPGQEALAQMAGLLTDFVENVPGVTHTLLISRDGLKLVDSDVHRDWADTWAATLGSLASLCESIPGPTGGREALKLVLVEREDAVILASIAGESVAFPTHPGNTQGVVDTVLAVIARPDANVTTVGYEMGVLVDRFAPYMLAPVRSA
ncbi:roadblock/LC7 domain-containing protein [Streptomyces sp. NPDC057002]|uniref:roadblock/LC7 domain-containing protein n=1 Tax=Streptomyces sp. NPDC057002 TaxID=3345992 RepID=UPI00362A444B